MEKGIKGREIYVRGGAELALGLLMKVAKRSGVVNQRTSITPTRADRNQRPPTIAETTRSSFRDLSTSTLKPSSSKLRIS